MTLSAEDIPLRISRELVGFRDALVKRLGPVIAVRMPHAEILPIIRYGGITIVIQDEQRVDIPVARMYYLEVIDEIQSQVEKQVRIERDDFTSDEMASWKRLRSHVKSIAWRDYQNRVGQYFRDSGQIEASARTNR